MSRGYAVNLSMRKACMASPKPSQLVGTWPAKQKENNNQWRKKKKKKKNDVRSTPLFQCKI